MLVEEDGCLFVSVLEDRWLLFWPEGYTARTAGGRIQVLDGDAEVVGDVGDRLQFGGGESNPIEVGGTAAAEGWASELTGVDIPEKCGDLYWIVAPG